MSGSSLNQFIFRHDKSLFINRYETRRLSVEQKRLCAQQTSR
jgi:hypothetical protein